MVRALDGDLKQIQPLDMSDDGGARIRASRSHCGRRLDETFVPRRIKVDGPRRTLTDVYDGLGFLVNDKFREILEELEPNVHQFIPIELFWQDGSKAADKFWFVPCNRIDSLDRDHTTLPFGNRIWFQGQGGTYVFSRAKIGNRHAWVDKHLPAADYVIISDEFHRRLLASGVTGLDSIHSQDR